MAKSKSYRQIGDQLYRILNYPNRYLSQERRKKANQAYDRYWNNISNTRTFQNDQLSVDKARFEGWTTDYKKADDRLMDRKYSRATYMGLANNIG